MAGFFQARLQAAMLGGNLTVADLARWFEVPYPTVRGWVQDGHEPSGGPRDRTDFLNALVRLESAIRRKDGLPLRRGGAQHRIVALDKIRNRVMRGANA